MPEKSVMAEKLKKDFGKFTAVDSISFSVEKGEIYCFLGANGAGKSTTIRMLCGLLEPTSGDAIVNGISVKNDPEGIKQKLGYMSQKFSLYNNLSVKENITFFAGIYGLRTDVIKKRREEVINQLELCEYGNTMVNSMPLGMKQRVSLACAIIHNPEILFLDEPTAGVGPLLRRRFWELIDGLSKKGTTVFVTTHYMDEVEHCHRLSLMHAGKIIAEGTVSEIKNMVFPDPIIEIETEDIVPAFTRVCEIGQSLGFITMHGPTIHIIPKKYTSATLGEIKSFLMNNSIAFREISEISANMEDVFVDLIYKYENQKPN